MSSSVSNTTSSISSEEKVREFFFEACVLVVALIFALLLSIFVSYNRFFRKWMHESLAVLVLGVVLGAIQYFLLGNTRFAGMLELFAPGSFSDVFYDVLFPLVVFNAGFTLKQKNFVKNLGSITVLTFVGITLQAICTGCVLYLAGSRLGIGSADLIECLVFGSLLSATDTVATMAVLIELNVQPLLHSLVFGESLLNDAVAIALVHAMSKYIGSSLSWGLLGDVVVNFVVVVFGSALVGLVCGLLSAFLAAREKSLHLSTSFSMMQVLFFAYLSYCFAEVFELSGVFALFVCSIVMSHYLWYSLQPEARKALFDVASALDFLAEILVFLSLGILIFTPENISSHQWSISFIVLVIGVILLSRAVSTFSLSGLLNLGRKEKIPLKHQVVVWFCGMRGIVTLLLALNLSSPHRSLFINTSFVVILFTSIVLGPLSRPLVANLNVGCRVHGINTLDPLQSQLSIRDFTEYLTTEKLKERGALRRAWFLFDNKVLKKLFGGRQRLQDGGGVPPLEEVVTGAAEPAAFVGIQEPSATAAATFAARPLSPMPSGEGATAAEAVEGGEQEEEEEEEVLRPLGEAVRMMYDPKELQRKISRRFSRMNLHEASPLLQRHHQQQPQQQQPEEEEEHP